MAATVRSMDSDVSIIGVSIHAARAGFGRRLGPRRSTVSDGNQWVQKHLLGPLRCKMSALLGSRVPAAFVAGVAAGMSLRTEEMYGSRSPAADRLRRRRGRRGAGACGIFFNGKPGRYAVTDKETGA